MVLKPVKDCLRIFFKKKVYTVVKASIIETSMTNKGHDKGQKRNVDFWIFLKKYQKRKEML